MPQGLGRFAGRLGLALFGTLLFGIYATWPRFGHLPYVCLVPWTVLYTDPKRGRVSWIYFAIAAYAAWVFDYAAVFRWGWFAPLVMAAVFVPTWLPFPFLIRAASKLDLPRALTLPVIWIAVEWFRVATSVGHFDIFLLGYSQAPYRRLAQIADLFGVYGVSFLVAMVNGLFADAYFVLRDGGYRARSLVANRRFARTAGVVAGVLVLVMGYGVIRVAGVSFTPGPRLAVIQPNIAHTPTNFLGVTLSELAQTDAAIAPGSADLIVWPENAILDDFFRKDAYLPDLRLLAAKKNAPILLGAEGYPEARPEHTTNSAFLVGKDGEVRGRYDKQVLYPWTEEVPFDAFLGAVAPRVRAFQRALVRKAWGTVSTGVAGSGMEIFRLPWNGTEIPFAALICVENSYPPLVAEAGRLGARFFVNITSEGSVGGSIQEQLLRVCMTRAIENRIAYVRCGNTGISGFIDPDGRLRSVLHNSRGGTILVAGTLTDRVSLAGGGPTVYARSRDAFALLCVAAAAGLALAGTVRRRVVALPMAILIGLLATMTGCARWHALDTLCSDEAACRLALPTMAATFRKTDAAEHAIEAYDHVIQRFPALGGEVRAFRAYFLDRSGDLVGAAADCEASLREHPEARTWALLGSIRARMHDPARALLAFEEAVRLSPADPETRFLVARSHWEIGDVAEARRVVEETLMASPRHAASLTLCGKLDIHDGREGDAIAAFTAAAAADPTNLEARYYLARLAWRDGREGEFKSWLDELRANEAKLARPRGGA